MRRTLATFLFIGIAQCGAVLIPQTVRAELDIEVGLIKTIEKDCTSLLRRSRIRSEIAPSICKEYLGAMVTSKRSHSQSLLNFTPNKFKLNVPGDDYYDSKMKTWRQRVNAYVRISDEEFRAAADTLHDELISKGYIEKPTSNPKRTTVARPVPNRTTTPSRSEAQTSDPIHEKCLQARDYQGCVDSFSGRRSSSSSSDYERRMLELKKQELMEQRIYAREQQRREYARAESERKKEVMQFIQKGFDNIGDAFRGPDTLNCTTSNSGSFGTINCY